MNFIYQYFLRKIKNQTKTTILDCVITSEEDLKDYLKKLNQYKNKKVISVIALFLKYGTKSDSFIEELNQFYNKNQNNYSCYIFSTIGTIYDSLELSKKIISKSVFHLQLLDINQTFSLINEFSEDYDFEITDEIRKKIFEYSGGHIGLIKRLTLLAINKVDLNLNDLIKKEEIQIWIKEILNDIPNDLKDGLNRFVQMKTVSKDILFKLSKFNYLNNGKVFSPILEEFIIEKLNNNSEFSPKIIQALSNREISILEILLQNKNSLINKDTLAKMIWGEDWIDKYSDWAINQFVHRFRKKLNHADSSYNIIVKRGRGIMLS